MADAAIPSGDMERVPSRHRWSLALRGVVALIVGFALLAVPAAGLVALVAIIAALFAVDGLASIGLGLWHVRSDRRWWLSVIQGLVSLAVAAFAVFWPGATLLALIWLTAAWAIWQGVSELLISRLAVHGGWLAFAGALSILLGILMIAIPYAGVVGLVMLLAVYAFIRGISLLVAAFGGRPERGVPA
ncbi:MAG: DUF308 domain-containing protein [Magnetospirillum sp.]|nr:DUF308 domain-containing protein [Magnetospirillum sp.]